MRLHLLHLIIVIVVTSCSTGRIADTTTKVDETIIIGRIKIISNLKTDNKLVRIHFNNRTSGKFSVLLDKDGLFYTKVPIGTNFIASINHNSPAYYKHLPNNYISFSTPSSKAIYYIGDIEINLLEDEWKEMSGGSLNVIINAKQPGDKVDIRITRSETTIEDFNELFPLNKKEIITSLSIVNK